MTYFFCLSCNSNTVQRKRMSQIKDIEQLITRYLNGECKVGERNKLLQWIDASESNKKLFYRIKDVWDASLKKEDRTQQALFQFYKHQATKSNHTQKNIQLWRRIAGIAAVLLVGLVSIVLLNMQTGTDNMVTFKVPLGSRSELSLADGSKVILNAGSEISYASNFNAGSRVVHLHGEAYFEVNSDKSNPFVVKTTDFDIVVTGTQFNVCTYDDNNFSSVTLAEGKLGVQFSEDAAPIGLIPGKQFKLNRESRKYRLLEAEVNTNIAWKDGEFSFKEIPFPEMIKRLERWYDVTLNYSASALEGMMYTGTFKNKETIWQVLDALKLTSPIPIDYEKQGFRAFNIIYTKNKQPM